MKKDEIIHLVFGKKNQQNLVMIGKIFQRLNS